MTAALLARNAKQDYFAHPAFQLTLIDGNAVVADSDQSNTQILYESDQFTCSKISEPSGQFSYFKPDASVKAEAIEIIKQLPCLTYEFDKNWVYTFCDGEVRQEFSPYIKEKFKNDPINMKKIKESVYVLGVVDGFDDEELKSKPDGSYYLKKYLLYGDYCAKIGTNRAVIVNYLCGSRGKDYISSAVEFSVCMYRITVRSAGLCKIQAFQPPSPPIPGTIQCIRKKGKDGATGQIIGPDMPFIEYAPDTLSSFKSTMS